MQEGSRRAVIAALLANLAISITKFVGYGMTGAASLLAEAVHSVADTSNQALLLFGGSRAKREATPEHPFGYGRERYFWAFVVSMLLFSLGSLFAIYEGVDKLRHPHAISSPAWAVGILLAAMVFEALAFWNAAREAQKVRGKTSWWAFLRRTKNPELPVVLLEDSGALLGLVFALVGVGLAAATGDPRYDALGSVAIGLLLGAIAVFLAVEMKSLLIGESAGHTEREHIVAAIEADPAVVKLIHLRTQHLGPEELLVAAKVGMPPGASFAEIAENIDRIEAAIRQKVPIARVIYVEPDVYDSARQPA